MRVGTKSLLFGVHQFIIHPIFVAWGWWRLYGWPWDPRLWIAFVVHDWGYWGKPNMDGIEGEQHPYLGANIMYLFGGTGWFQFMVRHSRFLCRQIGVPPSRLCWADKYAIILAPRWLYWILASASGEWREYVADTRRDCLEARGNKTCWQFIQQMRPYIAQLLFKEIGYDHETKTYINHQRPM